MDDDQQSNEKLGKIFSYREVAQQLSAAIAAQNVEKIQEILNSLPSISVPSEHDPDEFESVSTVVIKYLEDEEYDRLMELQAKSNSRPVTTDEIDEYVQLSEKFARAILYSAKLIDKSATAICNMGESMINVAHETIEYTKEKVQEGVKNCKNIRNELFETAIQSYAHTHWFLRNVIRNPRHERDVLQHIKNKYGHLLFTYNAITNEIIYDKYLDSMLIPEYMKSLKEEKGFSRATTIATSVDHELEKIKDKKAYEIDSKLQRSKSLPDNIQINKYMPNIPDPLNYKIIQYVDPNMINTLIGMRIDEEDMDMDEDNMDQGNMKEGNMYQGMYEDMDQEESKVQNPNVRKRSRSDEEESDEKKEPKRPRPGAEKGGKTRRKSRRKNKTKTKKIKTNKKTKKRNMNRKTSKRKTRKRRIKK